MFNIIAASFIGALAMLTWIVLASYIYEQFIKELKR